MEHNVLTAAEPVTARITAPALYVTPYRETIVSAPPGVFQTPAPYQAFRVDTATEDSTVTFTDGKNVTHSIEYKSQIPLTPVLKAVWHTGMYVMAAWFLLANLRFMLRLRRSRKPYPVENCPYPVYLTADLPSPCLFGLFHPAVYLTPAAVESPETLRHVLIHETTHARHLDPLWSLLRCVCLAVYWFDPLVWIAAIFSRRDCELACDEGALRQLGESERIPYGQTLLRLIRDAQNTEDPSVREAYGRLAGIVGVVCNVLLFVGKFLLGTLTGSVAITADAVNNLSDASSSIVTLIGFRLAAKPADEGHPFGHHRIEYLAGLAVAAMILLIGAELVKTSIGKILHPADVECTAATILVLLASILVKLWLARFNRTLGKKISSPALMATAADSRNDVITTAAVLLCAVLAAATGLRLDGYVGLLVALFILWSGSSIAKDTIDPLLGAAPDESLLHAIASEITGYGGILGIHDLMVHDYGPGRRFASAHAEVDYRMNILDAHELLDDIERDVRTKLHVDLVLHCDPIVTDDAERSALRDRVLSYLTEQDARLSIHDFRVVRGTGHTNVIFDLVMPFDLAGKTAELQRGLERALSADGQRYHAVITADAEAFNDVHTRPETRN